MIESTRCRDEVLSPSAIGFKFPEAAFTERDCTYELLKASAAN
jgi:hypothetical protein